MKKEIFRFLSVGGGTFLFEFLFLYVLVDVFGFFYLYASAIAFSLAVIINYYLCVAWVFEVNRNRSIWSKCAFLGSSLLGLGLNQICMWMFVEIFGVYYLVAKVLATGVVTVWNYITKKRALSYGR